MSVLHRVSLIGFGTFERTTFDLFFRMAEQRSRRSAGVAVGAGLAGGSTSASTRERGYLQVAPSHHPEIVLINGDVPDAVQEAWRWPGRCVGIGGAPFAGAVSHLPRPANMQSLLGVLDGLVRDRRSPAADAARAESVPSQPPLAEPARLLVVDDNDNTLRSMRRFLRRLGLPAHFARSGEEALWRVSQTPYALVLLDSRMAGISGWVTCRLIKTRPYPSGRQTPRVVMMARPEGVLDLLRERLCRCDARISKPLRKPMLREQLLGLLARGDEAAWNAVGASDAACTAAATTAVERTAAASSAVAARGRGAPET